MKLPALHSTGMVEPGVHDEPAGHALHSSTALSPRTAPNVPPGHANGAALAKGQYEPSVQLTGTTVAPLQ